MISKILVANRGEIARRIFRTCREMGITGVAIYSDADHDEPHRREADEAIHLRGTSSADTYLNIDAVLAAAGEAGADAVHPGYGFLAENARFAEAVDEAGLTWIGPPAHAIEVMGSKLASKELVESVGVPVLPSMELGPTTDALEAAKEIGYPVLVKASAGGGGKGMRIVGEAAELVDAVEGARREAAAAFGDDTLFLETYLQSPRHIEIQVFGDTYGHLMSMHERECSIQRRHQKIMEEAPSPAIEDPVRAEMAETALRVAGLVGYVGAGTVEFLFQEGSFYFLEMNTRLQVEHPVTEMVTGLDLVRLQIEVAGGEPLPASKPSISGHAIEARLYAEDPLSGFLPVTGEVHRFRFEPSEGLRVDAGVEDGSVVSVHYDPMIAKVIAHGPTRQAAASILSSSLRRATLHLSTTNRALLVRVLESEDFLSGDTDTHFLQRHDLSQLAQPLADPRDERLAAIAAALADQAAERHAAAVQMSIPSGWRNSPAQPQSRSYQGFHDRHEIRYTISKDGFDHEQAGHVKLIEATPSRVTISIDGEEQQFAVARYGNRRYVDTESVPTQLTELPRFPSTGRDESAGSLQAPMPGRVVRVDAAEGEVVAEGQVLVVMEAMKMEHTLRAPHAGTVTAVRHQADDQVEGGAILVVVEPQPESGTEVR